MKFKRNITKAELEKKLRQVEKNFSIIANPERVEKMSSSKYLLKRTILVSQIEGLLGKEFIGTKSFLTQVPVAIQMMKDKLRVMEEKELRE